MVRCTGNFEVCTGLLVNKEKVAIGFHMDERELNRSYRFWLDDRLPSHHVAWASLVGPGDGPGDSRKSMSNLGKSSVYVYLLETMLSYAGRACLVRHALLAVPSYWLVLSSLP